MYIPQGQLEDISKSNDTFLSRIAQCRQDLLHCVETSQLEEPELIKKTLPQVTDSKKSVAASMKHAEREMKDFVSKIESVRREPLYGL